MVENKILSVIERYNMIHRGDTVIAAVSGGADSMCMLHFLNKFSSKMGFNIIVAHVNHGIRGKEAYRDEDFVRSYCLANNIEFVCAHYNVPEISKETKESEELCGRRLRYEFFNSVDPEAKIATAHNLNDSMETFMFNLSRGTGLKGLSGIPYVKGNIIRPLIECTREEIEESNSLNNISYVTDSTNLQDEYTRNKIRHSVIPVLRTLNPSFSKAFLNCIQTIGEAEDHLEAEATEAFLNAKEDEKFITKNMLPLHPAIKNRVIIMIAEYYGAVNAEKRHVDILSDMLASGGSVTLPGDIIIRSDGSCISKVQTAEFAEIKEIPFNRDLKKFSVNEKDVAIIPVDKNKLNIYNNKKVNDIIDSDKATQAVFRSRQDGDKFKYPNSPYTKTIKNLFNEKKIPAEERSTRLFLADDKHILWIEGIGVSEYGKCTSETACPVKIEVRK